MMIVIKPDGKLKVWRKASEKWRPECLGYIANVSSSNIKIMVWGLFDILWCWNFSIHRWKYELSKIYSDT